MQKVYAMDSDRASYLQKLREQEADCGVEDIMETTMYTGVRGDCTRTCIGVIQRKKEKNMETIIAGLYGV